MDRTRPERIRSINEGVYLLENTPSVFFPPPRIFKDFLNNLIKDLLLEAEYYNNKWELIPGISQLNMILWIYEAFIFASQLQDDNDVKRKQQINLKRAEWALVGHYLDNAIQDAKNIIREDPIEEKVRHGARCVLAVAEAQLELFKFSQGQSNKIILQRRQKALHQLTGRESDILKLVKKEFEKAIGKYEEVPQQGASAAPPDEGWIPDHVKQHQKQQKTESKSKKKKKPRSRNQRQKSASVSSGGMQSRDAQRPTDDRGDHGARQLEPFIFDEMDSGDEDEDESSESPETSQETVDYSERIPSTDWNVVGGGKTVKSTSKNQSNGSLGGSGLDSFGGSGDHGRKLSKQASQNAGPMNPPRSQRQMAQPVMAPQPQVSPRTQDARQMTQQQLNQRQASGASPFQGGIQQQRGASGQVHIGGYPQQNHLQQNGGIQGGGAAGYMAPQSGQLQMPNLKEIKVQGPTVVNKQNVIPLKEMERRVSPLSRFWLNSYEFRLGCNLCFSQNLGVFGIRAFRYDSRLTHQCVGSYLLCRLRSAENSHMAAQGIAEVWGRIRPRTNPNHQGVYRLCRNFMGSIYCQTDINMCHFAHSQEELMIWSADREGKFQAVEILNFLRSKMLDEQEKMEKLVKRQRGKEHEQQEAAMRKAREQQQQQAVRHGNEVAIQQRLHHSAPRASLDVGDHNSVVKSLVDKIRGHFLFLCEACFDGAPQRISYQSSKNPQVCLNSAGNHLWKKNKVLAHVPEAGGFQKVRPRPNGIPAKAVICWHLVRQGGCYKRNSCQFAHNASETNIWEFEVGHSSISREQIVKYCDSLRKLASKPSTTIDKTATTEAKQEGAPTIPPFQFLLKVVCGFCYTRSGSTVHSEQNPQNPKMCKERSHPWQNVVYLLYRKAKSWIRVFARHEKLRPEIHPQLCRRREKCDFRGMFGSNCMFPHYQEELDLWKYQARHSCYTIDDVIAVSQGTGTGNATTANHVPAKLPNKSSRTSTSSKSLFFCSYCQASFNEIWHFEQHLKTREHIQRVTSDKERNWEYREPPLNVVNNEYQRCSWDVKGMCRYSGRSEEENQCQYAHSEEELLEWKERHGYRMMKLQKVSEQKLFLWVDEVLQNYNFTSNKETVMVSSLPGVELSCSKEYEISIPVEEKNSDDEYKFEWPLQLTIGEEKKLRRIGLLYDEHRSHFFLSHPLGETQPQTCPANMVVTAESGRQFNFKLSFTSAMLGVFHQYLVFDFDPRPLLYVKLIVKIGSKLVDTESLTKELLTPWNEKNSEIVKFPRNPPQDEFDVMLLKTYMPLVEDDIKLQDNEKLSIHNFREFMHKMIHLEEIACNKRLQKFSGKSKMEVMDTILDGTYQKAQGGQLFGKISLRDSLLDDSEASQIVIQSVSYALLKFDLSAKEVYEVEIIADKGLDLRKNDSIYVRLSPMCATKQGFIGDNGFVGNKTIKVFFQFQLQRLSFCFMHYGVDHLEEEEVLFPKPNLPPRFPGVRKDECYEMNPRQEDASRYITQAGSTMPRIPGATLLIGPFGTGKTHTLAKTIQRLLLMNEHCRILVCTHSNSAADWYITEHIHPVLQKNKEENPAFERRLLRIYAPERNPNAVDVIIKENYALMRDGRFVKPTMNDVYGKHIVMTTLATAIHLLALEHLRGYFMHIFIDEAGQALETESLIPLGLATKDTIVVLAGDHRQMRPKVYSERARYHRFQQSMLERLFYRDKYMSCRNVCFLTWNYRMRPEILNFIAKHHYENKLRAVTDHPLHPDYYPLGFSFVKGEDQHIGTSYVNVAEVTEIVERVEKLVRNWPGVWGNFDKKSIAVLTPYRLQVEQIRRMLRLKRLNDVTVETVQNVQGKQYRAVFISTVRTRKTLNKAQITAIPQNSKTDEQYYYGFLSDEGLLITAITRAQSLLFIAGDPVALCSVGDCSMTWRKFIEECEKNYSLYPIGTSMDAIKQEILDAKQALNPTANPFQPKPSETSKLITRNENGTAPVQSAWAIGPPSSVYSTPRQGKMPLLKPPQYQRLPSKEYPKLESTSCLNAPQFQRFVSEDFPPLQQESQDENEFGDYEDDINIDDDILRELRRQVKLDERDLEQKPNEVEAAEKSDSEESFEVSLADLDESEASLEDEISGQRSTAEEEGEGDFLHVDVSQIQPPSGVLDQQAAGSVTPTGHREPPQGLGIIPTTQRGRFRMVEREERIFIIEDSRDRSNVQGAMDVEAYDSDNEEQEEEYKKSERTEEEWLKLVMNLPNKFKLCVMRFEQSGKVFAQPRDGNQLDEIVISSKRRRERALDGDEVIMEILVPDEEDTDLATPDWARSRDAAQEVTNKVYGTVRHIISRSNNPKLKKVVCTVDPINHYLMAPIDRSFPKMFHVAHNKDSKERNKREINADISMYSIGRHDVAGERFQYQRNIIVPYSEIPQKLFVVQYWEWFRGNPYPMGVVTEELNSGDTPRDGMHVLKLLYGIKDKWAPSLEQEISSAFPDNWTIPMKVMDTREDLRVKDIFTIDPPDSQDLDDAIHIERLQNGSYKIGVHIADVSYFIKQDSNLDKEARKRGTTFYPAFFSRPSHMLPSHFSTRLCSLLPKQDKLTISVLMNISKEGVLLNEAEIVPSVINSCRRLTYEEAERFLMNNQDPPTLTTRLKEQLRDFHAISTKIRGTRLGDEQFVRNPDTGEKEITFPLAHTVVEEMMILANEQVAKFLCATFKNDILLRRQIPPGAEKVKEWLKDFKEECSASMKLSAVSPGLEEILRQNMIQLPHEEDNDGERDGNSDFVPLLKETWNKIQDARSSGGDRLLSLQNIIGNEEDHPKQAVGLANLYKILGTADYLNLQDDPERHRHHSLRKDFYTHFTSPIRRYIDLVVHRLVKAALDQRANPYSPNDLSDIAHHCTNQTMKGKKFGLTSQALLLSLQVKETPMPYYPFVESTSEYGLQLIYPHSRFIQSTRTCTNIPFKLLKPIKRPEEADGRKSFCLRWKNRVYDLRTSQLKEVRSSDAQLDADRFVVKIPSDIWADVLSCVKDSDYTGLEAVLEQMERHVMETNTNERPRENVVKEVTCEMPSSDPDSDLEPKKYVEFQRVFQPGQVVKVQLCAGLRRGVLVPKLQLFGMTPKYDFCTEHREEPVQSFAKIAGEAPARCKSISRYVKTWLPLVEMMVAYNTVQGDETIVMRDVEVQWYRTLDNIGVEKVHGCFSLGRDFCHERRIGFFAPKKEHKFKEDEQEQEFVLDAVTMSYLCIRMPGYRVQPNVQYRLMEMEQKPGVHARNTKEPHPGQYTLVVHGVTRSITNDDKANMYVMEFEVNSVSCPIPLDLFDDSKEMKSSRCTVEFIPKSEPDKRMEEAMRNLNDTRKCSHLIRKICLQKSLKDMNNIDDHDRESKALLDSGKKIAEVMLPPVLLHICPPNTSQVEALKIALRNTFSVIQGPPGTGKTRTGAYLAYYFNEINKTLPALKKGRPQILYCGPSNKSVDVITQYLKEFVTKGLSIIRVYSESIEQQEYPLPGGGGDRKQGTSHEAKMDTRHESIALHKIIRMKNKPYAKRILDYDRLFRTSDELMRQAREAGNVMNPKDKIKYREIANYKKLLRIAEKEELKQYDIILCTCNASGSARLKQSINVVQCIIDEAGMCSEPETLIPMVCYSPYQIVLIGDHMQLRPIITEPNARALGVETSMMQRYKERAYTLRIQYRMHEEICRFPSTKFYDGKLITDNSVRLRQEKPGNISQIWPGGERLPHVFCHVVGTEETLTVRSEEGNEMSKSNPQEVYHAVRIAKALIASHNVMPDQLVILSQYRLQCAEIEGKLKDQGVTGVQVQTVIKSQGSEWDYVLLSTVRSMPKIEIEDKPGRGWKLRHLGFILDENQMNVAITRARRGIIIVGNKHLLKTHRKWKELIEDYQESGSLVQAREFPRSRFIH